MNFLPDLYVTCPVCEGQTVQPPDAGNPLPRPVDRRRARHAGRRGGRVSSRTFPQIARLLGSLQEVGLGYLTLGPVVDHALRRRGPTHQAGHRAGPRRHRQDALHPRRADHRPALRRHPQAAGRAGPAGRPGQHGAGDRAQPGRDQDRPTGSSTSGPKAARPAATSSPPARPRKSPRPVPDNYTGQFLRPLLARPEPLGDPTAPSASDSVASPSSSLRAKAAK